MGLKHVNQMMMRRFPQVTRGRRRQTSQTKWWRTSRFPQGLNKDRRRQTCQAKCPWDISLRRTAPCCKQQVNYVGWVIARLAQITCITPVLSGQAYLAAITHMCMDGEQSAVENLVVIPSPNGFTFVVADVGVR